MCRDRTIVKSPPGEFSSSADEVEEAPAEVQDSRDEYDYANAVFFGSTWDDLNAAAIDVDRSAAIVTAGASSSRPIGASTHQRLKPNACRRPADKPRKKREKIDPASFVALAYTELKRDDFYWPDPTPTASVWKTSRRRRRSSHK